MKNKLQGRLIVLNEQDNMNDVLQGKAEVIFEENTEIETIEIDVILHVKGKMRSTSNVVSSLAFTPENGVIQKNTKREFLFEIPTHSKVESYKGRNVSIFYELVARFRLVEDEKEERTGPRIAKKIKKLLKIDDSPKLLSVFEKIDKQKAYKVIEENMEMQTKFQYIVIIIFSILLACIFYFALQHENNISIFLVFLGVSIGVSALTVEILMRSLLGTIDIEVLNKDETQFICRVKNSKKWKYCNEAEAYYQVLEEVIDDRGTSTTTLVHSIYKSTTQELLDIKQNVELAFNFPKQMNLGSLNIENVKRKWKVSLLLRPIWGIPMKYYSEITVVKKE